MRELLLVMSLVVCVILPAQTDEKEMHPRSVETIKASILELANRFSGQGDPDFSKQRELDVLVEELLQVNPQPPVKERLHLLYGPWKQVWGPYDYRNNRRGVDPKVKTDEIYQVIFEDGYYYNVAVLQDRDAIALLRGEYKLDAHYPNMLLVHFTDYPGNKGRPEGIEIWELAALAEKKQLTNPTRIVPSWIVRWFFGGGALREVYTDETLRITYGAKRVQDREDESLYIMTRAD